MVKVGNRSVFRCFLFTTYQVAPNSKGITMADYRDQMQTRAGTQTRADIDQGLRSYMLGIYNYMATAIGVTGVAAFGMGRSVMLGCAMTHSWRDACGRDVRAKGGATGARAVWPAASLLPAHLSSSWRHARGHSARRC